MSFRRLPPIAHSWGKLWSIYSPVRTWISTHRTSYASKRFRLSRLKIPEDGESPKRRHRKNRCDCCVGNGVLPGHGASRRDWQPCDARLQCVGARREGNHRAVSRAYLRCANAGDACSYHCPIGLWRHHRAGGLYNPQMSLRRHLETEVKPWLSANCHWALNDRRLLFGAFEDIADQQAQYNFNETAKRPGWHLGSACASVGGPAQSDARSFRQKRNPSP